MSIKLRQETDTTTARDLEYENSSVPLTAVDVDRNFIALKQKCDTLVGDYSTTFNADGSLKDGAVTSVSLSDSSVTTAKLKDRSVAWDDHRNILYVTDASVTQNKIEGTLNDYEVNSGLTALGEGTAIYFKAALDNTASVIFTLKDYNTTTEKTQTLLSLSLTKQKDVAVVTGDIIAGAVYLAFYDGTTLQLANTLQDPVIEIKESISRVATFGPIEFPVVDLPKDTATPPQPTGLYDNKSSGLTEFPSSYTAMLHCTEDDGDFLEGDIVPLELATDKSGDHGFSVKLSKTDVWVARSKEVVSGVNPSLKLPKTSTGSTQDLTESRWKVVVRGTYQNDSTYSPAYVDRALSYPAMRCSAALTIGNYLYFFSAPSEHMNNTNAPLSKINLVTNRVILVATSGGWQNASLVRYSDDNKFRASSISIAEAGSGYAVGETITLVHAGVTATTVATFVVKAVDTTTDPANAVTEMYDVTAAEDGNNAGEYSTIPDSPVTTATSAGGGTGLKLTVNFSSVSRPRLFWTDYNGKLYWIEPNNSDHPETRNTAQNPNGTDVASTSAYNVQDTSTDPISYHGFLNQGHDFAELNSVKLYDVADKYVVDGLGAKIWNPLLGHAGDGQATNKAGNVYKFEGAINRNIEGIQWNPIKRRIYIAGQKTNYMHIFNWGVGNNSSLQQLFADISNNPPQYVKTIGIPCPAGVGTGTTESHARNNINVDWDTDSGEEKSITIAKYSVNGTVTRAAWKEDEVTE